MADLQQFIDTVQAGYTVKGGSIEFGKAMFAGQVQKELSVTIPLKTLNRHGLVAGATGTGKTKSLQKFCEQLSEKSIPVIIMDMKGDVSGISQPGTTDARIEQRVADMGIEWGPQGFPVEFLTISNEQGVRLRATISEFGPVLLAKILELNETQQSILSLIFKYADDKQLPLVDIKDLKKLIQYLTNEGKAELQGDYGTISTASSGLILRKMIEIEEQGAGMFFGEKSFEVTDLMRLDEKGFGYINILRLMDIQDKPKMFSTFMLSLLAEIFQKFPEIGDADQPKLMIIIDEAHLVFDQATNSLLNQLETVIKLIRSKGVGIVFCTQSPNDIPATILSQLGLKIQHALRAFTAQDRKDIKLVSENYPETKFYDVKNQITTLGIGEAFVTALNEKGEPTPLVHAMVAPPESRMAPITGTELEAIVGRSSLVPVYNQVIDADSAYEMLTAKLAAAAQSGVLMENGKPVKQKDDSVFGGNFGKSIARSMATSTVRNVTGQVVRGLLGAIFGKKSKGSSWF